MVHYDFVVRCFVRDTNAHPHTQTQERLFMGHKSLIECMSYEDAKMIVLALDNIRETEMLVRIRTKTGTLLLPLDLLFAVFDSIAHSEPSLLNVFSEEGHVRPARAKEAR